MGARRERRLSSALYTPAFGGSNAFFTYINSLLNSRFSGQTSTKCFVSFLPSFAKERDAASFAANRAGRRRDRRRRRTPGRRSPQLLERFVEDRMDKRQNRQVDRPPQATETRQRSDRRKRAARSWGDAPFDRGEPRRSAGGSPDQGDRERVAKARAAERAGTSVRSGGGHPYRPTGSLQPADPPVQYPASYAAFEGQKCRNQAFQALSIFRLLQVRSGILGVYPYFSGDLRGGNKGVLRNVC